MKTKRFERWMEENGYERDEAEHAFNAWCTEEGINGIEAERIWAASHYSHTR